MIRKSASGKSGVPYHKDFRFQQKSSFLMIRKVASSKNDVPYHKDFRFQQKSSFLIITKPNHTQKNCRKALKFFIFPACINILFMLK